MTMLASTPTVIEIYPIIIGIFGLSFLPVNTGHNVVRYATKNQHSQRLSDASLIYIFVTLIGPEIPQKNKV
ncbi:hypothetical protein N7530_010236 [Penicillium desertorum]|uniref:Uncharacterized protein n=1 Tax=Penicillium desertorum TaxID=1303715 RepID=A0A9X0BIW4_9EURO|nr:hypothetical protein N7530_010236 [Penicillium desertorum]